MRGGNQRGMRNKTMIWSGLIDRLAYIYKKKYLRSCLVHSLRSTAASTPHVFLDDVIHSWPACTHTFRVLMQYTQRLVLHAEMGREVYVSTVYV